MHQPDEAVRARVFYLWSRFIHQAKSLVQVQMSGEVISNILGRIQVRLNSHRDLSIGPNSILPTRIYSMFTQNSQPENQLTTPPLRKRRVLLPSSSLNSIYSSLLDPSSLFSTKYRNNKWYSYEPSSPHFFPDCKPTSEPHSPRKKTAVLSYRRIISSWRSGVWRRDSQISPRDLPWRLEIGWMSSRRLPGSSWPLLKRWDALLLSVTP